MATIVAAAGGGDWNTGSSWVGGVAPTAADDAQVPLAAGNMSIGAGAVCRSADFSTYTGTLSGTGTLTIGDATAGLSNIALKLVAGMTVTGPPVFSFISTSATQQTVDFASKTTGAVTFNATSGGSWQYTGGHTVGAAVTVTLTKGTLTINGQTCSWGLFNSSNSNVRSLTLGAATITMTGASATVWDTVTTTNLTLSAASSTITFNGTGAVMNGGSGNTYGTVIFSGAGGAQIGNSCTYGTLTRTGTAAVNDSLILVGGTTTVSGTFTVNSNSTTSRVQILSSVIGTARAISAATVVITNIVDFQDITGSGAATWTVAGTGATALGDCGGNSGITFTTPETQTWSGTSGGNWSANAWTSRVPLPQDDVVINTAFSASQTVTANMPRLGKSIDWTGATGTPTWSFSITTAMYGSLTLISDMTISGTSTLSLRGRSSYTITSNTKQMSNSVSVIAPGGTYTLVDSFSLVGQFQIDNGAFDAVTFNVSAGTYNFNNSNTRALTMGTGNWTITSTAATTVWSLATTTGLTFSGASAVIIINSVSANTRTFAGGGLTYGTLTYTVAGSTGELDITGANSFQAINFSDITNARSLKFTAATTTTIRNISGFNAQGTSGKLMTVTSITGAAFTMTSTQQQSCNYLSLTNSVVDATPKWYAGANSTDGTGNTNWVFLNAPSGSGSGSMQAIKSLQNLRSLM